MKIGYARVSTDEQSLESQIQTLKNLGCEKMFTEHASGKNRNDREKLNQMIDFAREGDIVYVTKVDRIARNTIDALIIAEKLKSKKVGMVFQDLGDIDINSDIGAVIFTTISAFAEMERKRILQRCNEGRLIAKSKGIKLGRSKNEPLHFKIKELFSGGMNKNLISKTLKCSRTTVYRVLHSINAKT